MRFQYAFVIFGAGMMLFGTANAGPQRLSSVERVPDLRPAILGPSPAETAQVQLGAYRAKADASDDWRRIMGQAKDLLGGLTPQIARVTIPGRGRFWRLRAGPVTPGTADVLCAQLKARGLECIPVNG